MSKVGIYRFFTLERLIKFIFAAVILYIGGLILTPFPYYLPPDFNRGFLRNKADFFYNHGYFVGFYAHIATAPIGLLLGTLQLSRTLRDRLPILHRMLGRLYIALVLIGVAPGGLVMATKSYGGTASVLCFGLISVLMWITTFVAWRFARQHRYHEHAQWMIRSYTLMCSAIFLRLISYALSGLNLGHMFSYQLAAWLSWVPAMIVLELILLRINRSG
ncbi:MAG: DUF2306 domain-containing protein [Pirellulaceae bacterium]